MLLEVKNLSKRYKKDGRIFDVINQTSFCIKKNEVLGLIGPSGSGKSTIAKTLMLLEQPSEGIIIFNKKNIFQMNRSQRKTFRRQVQMVFQNPHAALNPRMTLQQILNEPLDIHQLHLGKNRQARIENLLELVGLEKDHLRKYPHQFSGGQCQRICIARALSIEPQLLICDEPLSALDLSIQAQIINLLRKCQKELGLSILFISHDLAAVDMLADRIIRLESGTLVPLLTTNFSSSP